MIIRTPDNMTGAEARALLVALEGTAEERAQHSALWANCSDAEAREAVQDNLRDFGPWRLDGVLYTARAEVVAGRGEPYRRAEPYDRMDQRFKVIENSAGTILQSWDAVRDVDPAQVWTVVDCDGRLYVTPGVHFVNRVDYLLTQNKRGAGQFPDYLYC